MADALINLGDLSKPATVLIEKISEAVGGIAKPWQIKRIANAEAKADLIRTQAQIEISEIEQRALLRMVREEGQKQENIENITSKAIPHLNEASKPENIEKDWLTYFFDKSRLVSDDEMQSLWANILAGQANNPGKFSKKTVDLVGSLDKRDANLFTKLCTFTWMLGGLTPIILHDDADPYKKEGIVFSTLSHLDSLGLITYLQSEIGSYERQNIPKYFTFFYYGKPVIVEFPLDNNNVDVGKVLLTQAGEQLAEICGALPSEDFFNYILDSWYQKGLILSMPISAKGK